MGALERCESSQSRVENYLAVSSGRHAIVYQHSHKCFNRCLVSVSKALSTDTWCSFTILFQAIKGCLAFRPFVPDFACLTSVSDVVFTRFSDDLVPYERERRMLAHISSCLIFSLSDDRLLLLQKLDTVQYSKFTFALNRSSIRVGPVEHVCDVFVKSLEKFHEFRHQKVRLGA